MAFVKVRRHGGTVEDGLAVSIRVWWSRYTVAYEWSKKND